jgi:hypothetical protein
MSEGLIAIFAQVILFSNVVPFSPRGGRNRPQLRRQSLAPSERLMRSYSNQFEAIRQIPLATHESLFKYKIAAADYGTVPTFNETGCRHLSPTQPAILRGRGPEERFFLLIDGSRFHAIDPQQYLRDGFWKRKGPM